ncbi:hypothetical protein BCR35DRAFT_299292, partial [Leucosporidium creatinivorum]
PSLSLSRSVRGTRRSNRLYWRGRGLSGVISLPTSPCEASIRTLAGGSAVQTSSLAFPNPIALEAHLDGRLYLKAPTLLGAQEGAAGREKGLALL